jgi:DNA-directed RNA polymerase I subunit RPA2
MDLCWEADNSGSGRQSISRRMGALPIMVKSSACYLKGMNRQQLVAAKEESTEFGGYFICNGIERIIRMLILQVCLGPRAGQVVGVDKGQKGGKHVFERGKGHAVLVFLVCRALWEGC